MKYVAWFLTIVFGVTWGLCLLLRVRAASGDLAIMLAWLLPTVWSPTAAALLLTGLSEGSTGVRRELRRVIYRRGYGRWLAIAAVVPLATVLSAVLVSRATGDAAPFARVSRLPMMIVLQLVTGAAGEELGWRGFLLPHLQRRFGIIPSAWAMALLWSLWHVAGMLFPGTPLQIAPPALFLATVFFMGVFLAFLFERTSGSVAPTMIAHLSLNVTLGLGGAPPSSLAFWWTMVSMLGFGALIVTFVWAKGPVQTPEVVATS
jgi:membrane protease YdiL (CAAX protease family)